MGPQARAAAADEAAKGPALSRGELRTLYLDLLRRPPFDSERREYLGAGEVPTRTARQEGEGGETNGTADAATDLAGLTRRLISSGDFWRQWFEEQLYFFLLVDNFAPRGETLSGLSDELCARTVDVRAAIHRIALSSSFDQRNPGADTFVTVVLEQLAGLSVERHRRELEIGKAIYDGRSGSFLGSPGATQSDVVKIAVHSRGFAESFLAREHARYVHAPLDKRALGLAVDAFLADPNAFPTLLADWLASPAYRARLQRREPMDNRLFVRALFADVCSREPTREEFSRVRSALDGLSDPTPLRAVIARLLIESDQAVGRGRARDAANEGGRELVAREYRRLLGREPSERESNAMVEVLSEAADGGRLLRFALISHPEYQSY